MKIVDRTKESRGDISIVEANYIGEFRLHVVFSDGTAKTIDLNEFLKNASNPVFKKYRLKKYFKSFEIVNGNLNWNDYEMVFPIADLYAGSIS